MRGSRARGPLCGGALRTSLPRPPPSPGDARPSARCLPGKVGAACPLRIAARAPTQLALPERRWRPKQWTEASALPPNRWVEFCYHASGRGSTRHRPCCGMPGPRVVVAARNALCGSARCNQGRCHSRKLRFEKRQHRWQERSRTGRVGTAAAPAPAPGSSAACARLATRQCSARGWRRRGAGYSLQHNRKPELERRRTSRWFQRARP